MARLVSNQRPAVSPGRGAIVATKRARFRKDLDPNSKTKPLKKDTDGDGFNDKVDKKPLNKKQH
jgi:hypothetical protein